MTSPTELPPSPALTEAQAWLLFERLRWDGAPQSCPHCHAPRRCYYLQPRSSGRPTRTGAPTARRVWKCGACRRQFSVLTGTVFEGTRLPLSTWATAVDMFLSGDDDLTLLPVTASARRRVRHVLGLLTGGPT